MVWVRAPNLRELAVTKRSIEGSGVGRPGYGHATAQICCTRRALYSNQLALTGCNSVPQPTSFFVKPDAQSGDFAYLDCYSTEESICLGSPLATGPAVHLGAVIIECPAPGPLVRNSAVSDGGQLDGAYVIATGLAAGPDPAYCRGRGTYNATLGGGACQTNSCLHFAVDYVLVSGVAIAGDDCYFNCFEVGSG